MEKEANKRKSIRQKVLSVILLVVILILVSLAYVWITTDQNPIKIIQTVAQGIQLINNKNNPDIGASDPSSSKGGSGDGASSGSNSGGGGDSGESGSSSSGEAECITQQISYSLENINKLQTCNEYDEEICINKTVKCSIEIHNRDEEIQGDFEIGLIFVEKGKEKQDAFDSQIQIFNIAPQTNQKFIGLTNLQSTGQDGIANQNIDCLYNTISIPEKEIC